MQATHKQTPPFLATIRTLTNDERLWAWERRKQNHDDCEADDQRYLGALLTVIAIGLAIAIGQLFMPCLVVWTSAGVQCW